MQIRFCQTLQMSPPSGPDGAEISTSRLWQHNSWHSRLRMDRIQWRAAFPPPPWCPCSSWRKSLPTKTLPISLPTPLSRSVDQWLVVDWLQVHFYLTINICIILFHPYISSFHSTSLSYTQSILAICRPWPRFTVCRGRTQQSTGEGEGGDSGKILSYVWLFFLLFKTKSKAVTLCSQKTKQEEVKSLAVAQELALGVSSDAAAQQGSCRAQTCG